MTDREKLIELIMSKPYGMSKYIAGSLADHLLAHGVTIADSMPQTNADRIRAMSDEELCRLLKDRGCPPDQPPGGCTWDVPCEYCWRCWLQQPAEVGPHG